MHSFVNSKTDLTPHWSPHHDSTACVRIFSNRPLHHELVVILSEIVFVWYLEYQTPPLSITLFYINRSLLDSSLVWNSSNRHRRKIKSNFTEIENIFQRQQISIIFGTKYGVLKKRAFLSNMKITTCPSLDTLWKLWEL